jgi:hypothetical protein
MKNEPAPDDVRRIAPNPLKVMFKAFNLPAHLGE